MENISFDSLMDTMVVKFFFEIVDSKIKKEYDFLCEQDKEVFDDFIIGFFHKSEMRFGYGDDVFGIDYVEDKIWVWEDKEGGKDYYYDSTIEFLTTFYYNNKPFYETISLLTSMSSYFFST